MLSRRSRRCTHNGNARILRHSVKARYHFEGTKVEKVNTLNADGKRKRRGMVYGFTAKTKKAIVKLTEDSKDIEVFTGL